MKFRKDFVTNSSSSSFVVEIGITLKNGDYICFEGNGGTPETGRIDYFDGDAIVKVSPKQLGNSKNVDEMIQLLTDGVIDDLWDEEIQIFSDDNTDEEETDDLWSAHTFIEEIREKIKSMDDISSIKIRGDEENYCCYNRTFIYDRENDKYYGFQQGEEFEKDGSSGGDLQFDLSGCEIEYVDDLSNPPEDSIKTYYESTDDSKYFSIEYENRTIKETLERHSYKSDTIKDPFHFDLDCITLPNYKGVRTLDELTDTLIHALIDLGSPNKELADELISKRERIKESFQSIKGSSVESYIEIGLGTFIGYDFDYEDGEYSSEYRTCEGGW